MSKQNHEKEPNVPNKQNDNAVQVFPDPETIYDNPTFVGKIIGTSDKGRIKIRTLTETGPSRIFWLYEDDIIKKDEFKEGVVRLEVKAGSEVWVEILRKLVAGPNKPRHLSRKQKFLLGSGLIPLSLDIPPVFRPSPGHWPWGGDLDNDDDDDNNDDDNSGQPECGNCDWRYTTHCSGCNDENSMRRCAPPFAPY